MWNTIKQLYINKDLRKKILFTLGILVVFRFAAHIPIPGVNLENLQNFFNQNQVFGLLNIFSGGAMSHFSIILMGLAPFINASIIMQLLGMVIPRLEALQKEGEQGQQIINRYTRFLTVPLAALESFGMVKLLQSQSSSGQIIGALSPFQYLVIVVTATAGSLFLMWLGELISENGIGEGISLIIFVGIVAGYPLSLTQSISTATGFADILKLGGFLLLALVVTAGVVFVAEAQRKIPVSYAKRVRGQRMYGGVDTYLPLRVNQAGVIPIIFAISFMTFPPIVAKFFENASTVWLANSAKFIENLFKPNTLIYGIIYFVLVVLFTFFYTMIVFNPENVAENLQKQGGFIPGIRPGMPTQNYLSRLSNRIMLFGGIFLGIIAILPFIIQAATGIQTLIVGGTSLLIVVEVALDIKRRVESQLIMSSYEEF